MNTKTTVFFTLSSLSVTASMVAPAFAQQYGRYGDRMMGPGYHGLWGMGWMGLLFWVLIAVGLVLLFRWVWQMAGTGKLSENQGRHALEILKERYARGEIDKAEYNRIKKDLEA